MKSVLIGILLIPVLIFGSLLLCGFLHRELNFSFDAALIISVLSPFALAFLWELILETASESNDLKSFLLHLLGNIVVRIMAVVLVIGGLYVFAQVALCIGALVLGLGFAAGMLGIGGGSSGTEREIERLKDEIEDLEQKRDKLPTYNGILLGGSGISESKLKYNRRLRDEFNEQIQDKRRELDD